MSRIVLPRSLEVQDQLPEAAPRLRVESGRGLVEEHDLGVADHGQRDRQALPLPARELHRLRVRLVQEPDLGDHLRRVEPPRIEAREQLRHLEHGEARVERDLLELDADTGLERAGLPARVEAEHADTTGVALPQADEHLHGRRLAGAVGPEQAEDLSGLDAERDPVDRPQLPVPLAQIPDFDGWHPCPPSSHAVWCCCRIAKRAAHVELRGRGRLVRLSAVSRRWRPVVHRSTAPEVEATTASSCRPRGCLPTTSGRCASCSWASPSRGRSAAAPAGPSGATRCGR